jgi:hypothetical protein
LDGTQRDWQTAYQVWASEDPHRHAYEVLFAERSVEIVANLSRSDAKDHAGVLHDRCIGCHATAEQGDALQAGVSCESCHGPAANWLDEHYLTSWPERRASAAGFHDTKQLAIRAAVCTGCHVGPMLAADGSVHDVNHDLIAAGHPRLTFELDAYLTNYPKHWNQHADEDRHRGSFHTSVWAAGQEQAARRLTWQIDVRQSRGPWPEFANFECFDCHHAIRPPSDARTAAPRATRGLPRPALTPLVQLMAVGASREHLAAEHDRCEQLLGGSWLASRATQRENHSITPLVINQTPVVAPFSAADLPAIATALAVQARQPMIWDQAVQFYLAVQALNRDWNSARLAAEAQKLADALGPDNFQVPTVTQYDSPTNFDPAKLQSVLAAVASALEERAQTNPR